MLTFLLLFMNLQHLDPGIQWQVPFLIQKTALSPSGSSIFLSRPYGENKSILKQTLYLYNPTGNLIHEFSLEGEVRHLWMDNENQIWVVFEDKLAIFSPAGMKLCDVSISKLLSKPFLLGGSAGLVSSRGIYLYTLEQSAPDLKKKVLRKNELSYEHIFSANPARDRIFICDNSGKVVLWYPFEHISYPYSTQKSLLVRYVSESPKGSLAMVYDDRSLSVHSKIILSHPSKFILESSAETPKKIITWERSFPLDIHQKPIWLSDGQNECLAFISEDRVLRIFTSNGLELTRKRVSYRPKALIQLDHSRCLASFQQSKYLLIYDFSTRKYEEEELEEPVIDMIKNGRFLLLVNREGHIKIRQIRTKSNQVSQK